MGSGSASLARAAKILGVAAIVWVTLAAAWGMFGTVGGGHYGALYSLALCAENMIRWKIIAPVWDYVATAPTPAQYYCHHPFGCFWAQLPMIAAFGHHDWVAYVPGIVMSGLTALLVNRTANAAWGPVGAAAATVGYAMLPMTLAYANYAVLELTVVFGWALMFWGHSAMLRTPKKRYMAASAAGAVIAACGDWIGFVAVGLFLGWTLLRYVLPKRIFPPMKDRPYALWWMLVATATCVTFAFWLFLFAKWNAIADILGSANTRSSGTGSIPLSDVLEARRYRIDSTFTPLAIFLGKLALPIAGLRLLVNRKDEEFYSIATWIACIIHYVGFKQGADIHIFWAFHFGLYFAYAFGQLAVTIQWLVERGIRLFKRPWAEKAAAAATLGFVALFIILIAPDAWRGLRTGRETWGRFNEENLRSDTDEVRVLEMLAPRLPPGATLEAHQSLRWSWHLSWALHGLHADAGAFPSRAQGTDPEARPFFVARVSWMTAKELQAVAKDYHVQIFGDLLVVDRRMAPGALDAFTFEEREPNPIEWFFIGGTEPIMTLVHDPWATWEWRMLLGQPADPPRGEPVTPNQLRIAHNIAVTYGDAARATELRKRIDAMIAHDAQAQFTQGIELLGTRLIGGTSPRVEMWFAANDGPTTGEAQFNISARMEGPEPLSWIPPDPLVRPFNHPLPIPSHLWQKGCLYTEQLVLYHRIGVETYSGAWMARDGATAPARTDGQPITKVVTVR